MAAKSRPDNFLNNVPIALVLGSLKESLYKKLCEWAKEKVNTNGTRWNGKEKLIYPTQSNWIDFPEKLTLPEVKEIVSLIELFLQLDPKKYSAEVHCTDDRLYYGTVNHYFHQMFISSGQLWNILDVWPYLCLQELAIWNYSKRQSCP